MRYFIRVNDSNKIIQLMSSDMELEMDDLIEVTQEQGETIKILEYNYTYVDGEVIQGEPIEPIEEPVNEHEALTKETHKNVLTSTGDNLINMDTLIELDEKINMVMEHLGLNA